MGHVGHRRHRAFVIEARRPQHAQRTLHEIVARVRRADDGNMVALDVQVGDRIMFGKYSGNEIKLDGTEYIIMREDDVLGVLDAAPQAPSKAG